MAKTAVVNKRRRRRRTSNKRRRRRNTYGAAATANPRRRRRRSTNRHHRRRRRNPDTKSPYSSGGYRRTPNPGMFDIDELTDIVPAATGGVWVGRWALKQAGAFEPAKDGTLEPGVKHAIALWLAAKFGGQMLGQALGDAHKGQIATIACLGYAGDLFLRTRFMRDSAFVKNQLSLQGLGNGEDGGVSGFQQTSALGAGEEMTDTMGNRWVKSADGWALAGPLGQQLVQDEHGNVYSMGALPSVPGAGARLDGFQQTSALGGRRVRYNPDSSFGYATE